MTWGANASDPQATSYRALVADRLMDRFPRTPFRFHDAAIGGTGSDLGVFRLDRDVLAHEPDLVFLDFTANDNIRTADPQRLSSYEWIVRRLVTEGDAVVVPVILPFKGDATAATLDAMPGRDATIRIANAYHLPVADAVVYVREQLAAGAVTADELWPWDGAHPGDAGYALFAEAVWRGFEAGLDDGRTARVPEVPLHGELYRHARRFVLADAAHPLPPGWRVDTPSRVSAWFDGLPSRWLDRVVVAGGDNAPDQAPAPLSFTFRGQCVERPSGEETLDSGPLPRHPRRASPCPARPLTPPPPGTAATASTSASSPPALDESGPAHPHADPPPRHGRRPGTPPLESLCIAGSEPPTLEIAAR